MRVETFFIILVLLAPVSGIADGTASITRDKADILFARALSRTERTEQLSSETQLQIEDRFYRDGQVHHLVDVQNGIAICQADASLDAGKDEKIYTGLRVYPADPNIGTLLSSYYGGVEPVFEHKDGSVTVYSTAGKCDLHSKVPIDAVSSKRYSSIKAIEPDMFGYMVDLDGVKGLTGPQGPAGPQGPIGRPQSEDHPGANGRTAAGRVD